MQSFGGGLVFQQVFEIKTSGKCLGDCAEGDQTSWSFCLLKICECLTQLTHELESENIHFVAHDEEVDIV